MRSLALAILILMMSGVPGPAAADEATPLRVLTSEFPPYSYIQDGKPDGIVLKHVERILTLAGYENVKIEVYPWARAYTIARDRPNTVLFSVARTPKREDLFHWIGAVVDYSVYLYKLRKRQDIKAESVDDLNGYVVASLREGVKAKYLSEKGVQTQLINSEEAGLKMLAHNRIDILPVDNLSFAYRLEQDKSLPPPNQFEALFRLDEISRPLFLAANIQTSESHIERLKHGLTVVGMTAVARPEDEGVLK